MVIIRYNSVTSNEGFWQKQSEGFSLRNKALVNDMQAIFEMQIQW